MPVLSSMSVSFEYRIDLSAVLLISQSKVCCSDRFITVLLSSKLSFTVLDVRLVVSACSSMCSSRFIRHS